MKFRIQAGLCQ